MKTRINKSELFKKAWEMYKRYSNILSRKVCPSFGSCLRNAWFEVKAQIRKAEKEARRLMRESEPVKKAESVVYSAAMEKGITEYYRSRNGLYCGD